MKNYQRSALAVLLICIIIQACKQNSSKGMLNGTYIADTSMLQTIKIDPALAAEEVLSSSVFDSILYLPLETTSQSMFSEVSQLEVTKDFYIILDVATKSILFFNKEGKFHSKITNDNKNNEVTFSKLHGFTVDENKNEIIINDVYSNKEYVYDFEGKYLRFTNRSVRSESCTYLGNDRFIASRSVDLMLYKADTVFFSNNKDAEFSRVITYGESGSPDRWYLPVDTSVFELNELYNVDQNFFTGLNGGTFFSLPYDYRIYEIDSVGQFKNNFKLILPEELSLPSDFMYNDNYKHKRIKFLDNNKEIVYAITDFYQIGDQAIFRSVSGNDLYANYLYHLKTKRLLKVDHIISDKLSYKLPIFGKRVHSATKEHALISSLDAAQLFRVKVFIGADPEWEQQIPEKLKIFYRGNNLQNPVLVMLYLKK